MRDSAVLPGEPEDSEPLPVQGPAAVDPVPEQPAADTGPLPAEQQPPTEGARPPAVVSASPSP